MIARMSTTATTRVNGNGNNVQYHHHRRGHSFNAIPSNFIINNSSDHHLIFSNSTTRRTVLSSASSNHVVSSQKLGKLFAESEKLASSGFDDLLSSTDGGKHDYDWLLTPPRSPDFQAPPFRSSLGKPTSYVNNNNASSSSSSSSSSRHAQISKNKNESKAGREGSVSRCSISRTSTGQIRTSLSSLLITSSASSSSSSPITPRPLRSPSAATSRLATTPISSADKTRPSQIPRPYTPVNSHQSPPSPARSFSTSRPCTPTRRHSMPSPLPSSAALISKYCNSAPITPPRSSSASRRRGLQQAVVPADFPVETPPNLRTTLPADRPVSAGRSRPASTLKAKAQEAASCSSARRQPSPIARSRNGHQYHEEPPSASPSEAVAIARRSLINNKAASSSSSTSATHPTDSNNNNNGIGIGTGGRPISKKSLDMAIKHMEMIRRSSSGSLHSSTHLFPQSIRTTSAASKDEQHKTTKRDTTTTNNNKRWSL